MLRAALVNGKALPENGVITLFNRIPLARGLGSSSAAVVGGLLLGNELTGRGMDENQILHEATLMEGHPDNAAPALLGGLCMSVTDEKKKVSGLMRPIMDNLDVLLKNWQDPKGNNGKKERRLVSEKNRLKNLEKKRDSQYTPKNQKKKIKKQINELHSVVVKLEKEINTATKSLSKDQIRGMIETESLTFIRGRSLTNTYLIIDEAQNLTVTQAKGILTRAGKGTKIVLCGDPEQIDKTYIDKRTNGLSYIMDKMKESPLAWQITMLQSECERSALANEAAKLL